VPPANPIDHVLGAIVPRVIDAVPINEVVNEVDLNHLVSELDMNAIVDRLDIDALMARIDINGLIDRVDLDAVLRGLDLNALVARLDLDALVARLDVDALVGRIDIGAVIARVDLNALVQKIDINALIQGVDLDAVLAKVDLDSLIGSMDLPALMRQAKIDEIVSQASRGVTARLLDAVRRQLAAVDLVLIALVNRVFRRHLEVPDITKLGTLSGRIAGGISRLAAYVLDVLTISFGFSLLVGVGVFLVDLFLGKQLKLTEHGGWWLAGYALFAGAYYFIGLVVTGRSVGKGLVGLRVIGKNGAPLSPIRAAVRTIVYPISFIFFLGLIPIVTGKRRRALHDAVAGSTVVYDWGDRPAELPAPVTAWLRQRHGPDEALTEAAKLVALPDVGSSAVATTTNGHRAEAEGTGAEVDAATAVTADGTDATSDRPAADTL
jgi:uncharacterized RDD family membrane protein YckC